MADNRKINHEKGMFDAAAQAFPFLKTMWHMVCIIWDKDGLMNKRRAIQIMANAAGLYKENLEDQRILFLYGTPSEIKKELRMESGKPLSMKKYEAVFHRYNFLHLTGVKINRTEIASAIHFYEKCLGHRLMESDFRFARDGSTNQKLEILENMMCLKRNVTMIGDLSDRGWKLYSEKVAGNVCGCIGFVKDKNTQLNVPNTLLKKDIRDVSAAPIQKVYAIISKKYAEEKYSILEKVDKEVGIKTCIFPEEIERILDRKNL